MKKLMMSIVSLIVVSGTTFAQHRANERGGGNINSPESIERRVERKGEMLLLSDSEKASFKQIYTEYLTKQAALRKERPAREDIKTAKNDAEIMQELKSRMQNQKQVLELKEEYFGKLEKILNAEQMQKLFFRDNGGNRNKKFNNKGNRPPHNNRGERGRPKARQ